MAAFEFGMQLEKAWTDGDGVRRFQGVASSTALDTDKERLTERGIASMQTTPGIELLPTHQGLVPLGITEKHQVAEVDGKALLQVEGYIYDHNPEAVLLHDQMLKGKRYSLSVGGKVGAAHWEFDKEAGRQVRHIDAVALDHIAVLREGKQANPDAWLGAIAKSAAEECPVEVDPRTTVCHEAIGRLKHQITESETAVEKAGARHTAAEVAALHRALREVQTVCGCADCQAAIGGESVSKDGEPEVSEKDAGEYSTSFTANVAAERTERIVEEATDGLWELNGALRHTISAIVAGPETDKIALLDAALADYASAVRSQVLPAAVGSEAAITNNVTGAIEMSTEVKPEDVIEKGAAAAEPVSETVAEPVAEAPAATPEAPVVPDTAELDKARSDMDANRAELEKAQARIKELEKQPVAGGPVSTAAIENTDMTKDAAPSDELAELIKSAKTKTGRAGIEARRAASAIIEKGFAEACLVRNGFMDIEKTSSAITSSYDFSNAGAIELRWDEAAAIWGGVATPLLNRIGSGRARRITHEWQDYQIPAATSLAADEKARITAFTPDVLVPVVRTNTCELMAKVLQMTRSAMQEAANGVYGPDVMDLLASQLRILGPHLVASAAYDFWFSLEVTQASATEAATARKMAGLVGTVGSGGFDDGLLTTAGRSTVTDNGGDELTDEAIGNWLESIETACGSAGDNKPTAIYCSRRVMRKIAPFSAVQLTCDISNPNWQDALFAGQAIGFYTPPWGGTLDLVYEPQCAHSATAANNWMAALCEPNIRAMNLIGDPHAGGWVLQPQGLNGFVADNIISCECTAEAKVFAGHGVLHNFTVTV